MATKRVTLMGVLALSIAPLWTESVSADDWKFELSPYLWVAGVDGDIKVKRQDFEVSADFEDIFDQTKYGGSVILQANRERWVNFLQLDYVALENDDVKTRHSREDIHLEADSLLATFASGYRFAISQRSTLDLMAGVRYAGMEIDVDLNAAGNLSSDLDIYDAILMVRPRVALAENWHVLLSFSVGAGDSDLTWEVFPELIYDTGGNLDFRLGYRDLNYENKKGNDEIDFSMHGMVLGVGFAF
jgi:hypothetical protein